MYDLYPTLHSKKKPFTMSCTCPLDVVHLFDNKSFLKGLILEKCIFSFTVRMKRDCHRLRMLILLFIPKMWLFRNVHKLMQADSHFTQITLHCAHLELAMCTGKGYPENPFSSFLSFNLSWLLRA